MPPSPTPPVLQTKRKRDTDYSDSDVPESPAISLGALSPHKRRVHLRIDIPSNNVNSGNTCSPDVVTSGISTSSLFSGTDADLDSLFDEPVHPSASATTAPFPSQSYPHPLIPASLTAPPIPGLCYAPTVRLPQELADEVMDYCLATHFRSKNVNQVMLFERASSTTTSSLSPSTSPSPDLRCASPTSLLPPIFQSLLSTLSTVLLPILPQHTHSLLFPVSPTRARQAILNLYEPREGITGHVDLLSRFGDGIVGVSFGSGCVMRFRKVRRGSKGEMKTEVEGDDDDEKWDLYLPERSVIVLSEDARYAWTHGIEGRSEDYVMGGEDDGGGGRWIARGQRLSITFRWLLPGAEIVGCDDSDVDLDH